MSESIAVPQEIEDAVILWARSYNREAKVGYHRIMKCHAIQLSAPADDPKWAAYRDGKLKQAPHEFIPLNRQDASGHYVPIALEELGASGIVQMLEEANMWSGRGEYDDVAGAAQAVIARNAAHREEQAAAVEEAAKESAWLHRRGVFGLPQTSVGIDLKGAAEKAPPTGEAK